MPTICPPPSTGVERHGTRVLAITTSVLCLAALGLPQTPLFAQPPTITTQPSDRVVWASAPVSLSVEVSDAGPLTYQWRLNGTNLPLSTVITTVAGLGNFYGDGSAATNASLYNPSGVVVDASGNLFIADTRNHRIRLVTTNGVITTVAGGGCSGDGGAATNANLSFPAGVAVDTSGNLFIADTSNQRIRKVDTNGIITTVAGSSTWGYSGDGGWATNASLYNPTGVAVDTSGNLFIADKGNHRIRKVDTHGIITTVAGNGTHGYSGDGGTATGANLYNPAGVVVDPSGSLLIADQYNNRVRKVNTNGIITTLAGNGSQGYSGDYGAAINASLYWPSCVVVDASGNLFIADEFNSRIRKVGTNGIITTVAGNGTNSLSGDGGTATIAGLYYPTGVAVDSSGNLFIADQLNARIRTVSTGGIIATVAGNGPSQWSGDGAAATNANLATSPSGVAVDNSGELFIVAAERISKVNSSGILSTVAGTGSYGYSGDGGMATNASLYSPQGVAVDGSSNLFIADMINYRVRKVSPNGTIITVAGNGTNGYSGDGGAATNARLSSPQGVAVDSSGNLFIADTSNHSIRKVGTNGSITTVAGKGFAGFTGDGGPAANANLNRPCRVAVDATGNLFIADNGNQRVRKVNTSGVITTVAGGGGAYPGDGGLATQAGLGSPQGILVDHSGNLFIADSGANRIRKVAPNGIITTVAGNGLLGYTGDGGPPTNASLYYPGDVAVDSSGNLFIADAENCRIREVSKAPQGPTWATTSVAAANMGDYQVVVTSSGGSVTSSVATLVVATSPQIYQTTIDPSSGVTLNCVSSPGSTNLVLCTTNLAPPVLWQPFSTNLAGADGDWQFNDPNPADAQRFYRSQTQ